MEKTLVIMAAGIGSRFGGLKQITPMGPKGEFIIDYSIYDAKKAGFNKVVFIIKKENLEDFKQTIGKRVEDKIDTYYAFQDVKDTPVEISFEREKPWGTGQAILCAKKYVNENFLVINADDFYGFDAFMAASKLLDSLNDHTYGLIGYKVENTLTENGSVKRGVCKEENGILQSICESSVMKTEGKILCTPLLGQEEFYVPEGTLVSMNMFAFNPSIFDYLEKDFVPFLESANEKSEFLIPEIVASHIQNGDVKVNIVQTQSKWYGVTYKEDTPTIKNALSQMTQDGIYPLDLWK